MRWGGKKREEEAGRGEVEGGGNGGWGENVILCDYKRNLQQ